MIIGGIPLDVQVNIRYMWEHNGRGKYLYWIGTYRAGKRHALTVYRQYKVNVTGLVQFGGGECHGARYITHLLPGFYSDVVECLPVDPATWVRFPAGAGQTFSLYDIQSWPQCYKTVSMLSSA